MREPDLPRAGEIMLEFAQVTGLDPVSADPRRYLWTDAFAVCNYLGLYRLTGEEHFRDLALRLVHQVHHTLGRHRTDDRRAGWVSGLGGEEGERHPTIGGLRIGKRLPERPRNEPADEALEWDRDGQYYHYLTKWMHALHQVSRCTGDPVYRRWAMELAKTAHARFTHAPRGGGGRRMYWKMSIDLTYPLVTSMGQHDPLDGLITYCGLQISRAENPDPFTPDLRNEIADMARICRGMSLATDDPLGTGGLLSDALRIAGILVQHDGRLMGDVAPGMDTVLPGLLADVMEAALSGLDAFSDSGCLGLPADYRLAFRELGLAIGLSALDALMRSMAENPGVPGNTDALMSQAEALLPYLPLGDGITRFWIDRRSQEARSWTEHREINMVMLATALAPKGYLGT